MKKNNILKAPVKLIASRAWRTYLGGKLLDELHGKHGTVDGNFPEEWIISTVAARNTGREAFPNEGLCFVEGSNISLAEIVKRNPCEILGSGHVKQVGETLGVLAKLIDSCERLTIQVHPTKEAAKRFFNSDFGKTECWHILGGREIDGVKPCVYLGFKPGINRDLWEKYFHIQDVDGMLNCLHRYEVRPGDTFLIEGGVPHAIGSGCFLAEIQEPTDYSIRTERVTPGGFSISDFMCHQGLGFDDMFECFTYEGLTEEETYDRWHISPRLMSLNSEYKDNELVGYTETPFFKMKCIEISGKCRIEPKGVFSGLYILAGSSTIYSASNSQIACQGDQFMVPASADVFFIKNTGEDMTRVLQIFGPDTTSF